MHHLLQCRIQLFRHTEAVVLVFVSFVNDLPYLPRRFQLCLVPWVLKGPDTLYLSGANTCLPGDERTPGGPLRVIVQAISTVPPVILHPKFAQEELPISSEILGEGWLQLRQSQGTLTLSLTL